MGGITEVETETGVGVGVSMGALDSDEKVDEREGREGVDC